MLISDWSSDVCSSDLVDRSPSGRVKGNDLERLFRAVRHFHARRSERHSGNRDACDVGGPLAQEAVDLFQRHMPLDDIVADNGRVAGGELGRNAEPLLHRRRWDEQTAELQSLMRITY